MTYFKMIVIAPVSELPALRAFVAANFDTEGGPNWFVQNLSTDGRTPATHGWACFQATQDEREIWTSTYPQFVCASDTPPEALAEFGLHPAYEGAEIGGEYAA